MRNYYPDTITKIIRECKMTGGILVQGFPGLGLVGRIAGMHLIDSLKAREAAKIFSTHFPHTVVFQGKFGKLIHAELWAIEQVTPPLLVLTGEIQPNPPGMFQVLNAILDLAEEWGIKTVVAIGGLKPIEANASTTPDVTGFAYTKADADFLSEFDLKMLTEGTVSGAVGVITALAAERKLVSYGLLGKVRSGDAPAPASLRVDPLAAKNVLDVLGKIYDIELDLSKMERMVAEFERTEANAMRVLKRLEGSEEEKADQKSYYI